MVNIYDIMNIFGYMPVMLYLMYFIVRVCICSNV